MLRTVFFRAAPAALFLSVPASSFSALSTKPPTPAKMPDSGEGVCKLDEYRGANNWKGLIPSVTEPRVWDEGFRSFLLKYGMFNHVVYDVFIKGEDDFKSEETGLRGRSRFGDDFTAFSEKGLKFNYVNKKGEKKQEYDFTDDYTIVANLVCSPDSFFSAEDNWFGFIGLSKDKKEMVIVFRGTETTKEWIENATLFMEQLDGEPPESGLALLLNRDTLMVHSGFQQLYREKADQFPSPKDKIYEVIEAFKNDDKVSIEKVTVVGHSLGAAMAQHCAVDLAHSRVLGDVPILGLGWAAPKGGNAALAAWVAKQPNLRILRVRVPIDFVTNVPPDWMWSITTGGYKHMGTEITLDNTHLHKAGVVKSDDGNSPNHNLQQYLHNIDPTRDVALMNKVGNVIPDDYCRKHGISPSWHSLTFPRTLYR
ncbi:unnamed protein product [Ectocarpus sp. 6 AP-2014]